MDGTLTPDLSSTLTALTQYYPMQGTQEQGGGGGLTGMLGGENAIDYSGQFSDIRGLVDKGLGQITTIGQAQQVLGGQINAFSGTLTGVQSQVGGINSQVGDLKNQMATSAAQQAQMKQGLDLANTNLGTMGTNVTGLQNNVTGLQTSNTKIQADLARMITAMKRDPHMGGCW